MKDLVKVDGKTCLSCKYHVGFGAQPGSQCRDNTKNFKKRVLQLFEDNRQEQNIC